MFPMDIVPEGTLYLSTPDGPTPLLKATVYKTEYVHLCTLPVGDSRIERFAGHIGSFVFRDSELDFARSCSAELGWDGIDRVDQQEPLPRDQATRYRLLGELRRKGLRVKGIKAAQLCETSGVRTIADLMKRQEDDVLIVREGEQEEITKETVQAANVEIDVMNELIRFLADLDALRAVMDQTIWMSRSDRFYTSWSKDGMKRLDYSLRADRKLIADAIKLYEDGEVDIEHLQDVRERFTVEWGSEDE